MRQQMTTAPATGQAPATPVEGVVVATVALAILGALLGLAWELPGRQVARLAICGAALPWALLALGALRLVLAYALQRAEPALRVDLDGDGLIGAPEQETIRLLPVRHSPTVKLAGADRGFTEDDLRYMVAQLPLRGVAWRSWRGARLPSGLVLQTYEDYRAFPEMLERAGILRNRGPRAAGDLLASDPGQVRRVLGL